jgi:hypothetical protein
MQRTFLPRPKENSESAIGDPRGLATTPLYSILPLKARSGRFTQIRFSSFVEKGRLVENLVDVFHSR